MLSGATVPPAANLPSPWPQQTAQAWAWAGAWPCFLLPRLLA